MPSFVCLYIKKAQSKKEDHIFKTHREKRYEHHAYRFRMSKPQHRAMYHKFTLSFAIVFRFELEVPRPVLDLSIIQTQPSQLRDFAIQKHDFAKKNTTPSSAQT